jgi:NADH-quinone oxidoreductase subunit J
LLVLEMILILSSGDFGTAHMTAPAALAADESNTRALGILLYTDYLYTFEIAGLVLLVAIVAAIALAMRKRKDTKFQDPSKQVRVNRDDRVRIVKMKSGK